MPTIGSVPTTPDPDTSAKVSRYKWEPYRDTNWWCIYYFLPRGRHIFAKVCHRNGRCIAILSKSIGVRGRFDSPETITFNIAASAAITRGESLSKTLPPRPFSIRTRLLEYLAAKLSMHAFAASSGGNTRLGYSAKANQE